MTNRGFYSALVRALATDPTATVHFYSDGSMTIKTHAASNGALVAVFCPIIYLAHRLGHGNYSMSDFVHAAEQFGLPAASARLIAKAADANEGHNVHVRKALRTRLEPFQRTRPV